MSAHTPGPWQASERKNGACVGIYADDVLIADAHSYRQPELDGKITPNKDTREANARLIAAAPDMLETLRGINRALSPGNRTMDEMIRDVGYAVDRARGAIARAEGSTP